ncbi:MAG: hypothetical protein FWD13_12230 [Treponema sp.]|nr:hypothetical protein [Treponema sp.]
MSKQQIDGIKNHATCGIEYADKDYWDITETEDEIKGSTFMDNFNIYSYMYIKLGIKKEHIEIDEWDRNDFWKEYENE